jgi:hemolysin III
MVGPMNNEIICPISGESFKEERINYFTHLVGLALSAMGCVFLLIHCFYRNDFVHLISCSIYSGALISLYAASTFYHGCQSTTKKTKLKIVDHSCIYLMIAGSYTPFTLGPLKNDGGVDLLILVWAVAAAGIVFKIVAIHRFQALSLISYLGLGWLVVYNFPVLMEEMTAIAFALLVAGGIFYTVGTLFYMWDRLTYSHAIWHLFVLGGSGCHYFAILNVVTN